MLIKLLLLHLVGYLYCCVFSYLSVGTDRSVENFNLSSFIQALTTEYVQGAKGDVRIHVKALGSDFLLQHSNEDLAILGKHFHEAVQDLHVEGGCDHLPVGLPFFS